jgi:hypothetical protein
MLSGLRQGKLRCVGDVKYSLCTRQIKAVNRSKSQDVKTFMYVVDIYECTFRMMTQCYCRLSVGVSVRLWNLSTLLQNDTCVCCQSLCGEDGDY